MAEESKELPCGWKLKEEKEGLISWENPETEEYVIIGGSGGKWGLLYREYPFELDIRTYDSEESARDAAERIIKKCEKYPLYFPKVSKKILERRRCVQEMMRMKRFETRTETLKEFCISSKVCAGKSREEATKECKEAHPEWGW